MHSEDVGAAERGCSCERRPLLRVDYARLREAGPKSSDSSVAIEAAP